MKKKSKFAKKMVLTVGLCRTGNLVDGVTFETPELRRAMMDKERASFPRDITTRNRTEAYIAF